MNSIFGDAATIGTVELKLRISVVEAVPKVELDDSIKIDSVEFTYLILAWIDSAFDEYSLLGIVGIQYPKERDNTPVTGKILEILIFLLFFFFFLFGISNT